MPQKISESFFKGSLPIAVVSGGAGFVGSFFCRVLLEKKAKVICVDNWQTGVKENLKEIINHPSFYLLEQDVNKKLPKSLKRADYVVHLAGVEAYLNGEDVSIETLRTNSIGLDNLLTFCLRHEARFLLASTIRVYFSKISPSQISGYFGELREGEGLFSHLEAKRFAEALVSEYGQKYAADVRVVRFGDLYGPKMGLSVGNAVSRLVRGCVYGEPVELNKNFGCLYPVYVDDAVGGLIKSLFLTGTKNKIISLAGDEIGLDDLVTCVRQFNSNLEVVYVDGEKVGRIADDVVYAGRDAVSWQPSIDFSEGLRRTVGWFEDRKGSVVVGRVSESQAAGLDTPGTGFWAEKKVSKSRKFPKGRVAFVALRFLIVALLAFFGFPFVEFFLGLGGLYLAKNHLSGMESKYWLGSSKFWFSRAKGDFAYWSDLPLLGDTATYYSKKSDIFVKLAVVFDKSEEVKIVFAHLVNFLTQGSVESAGGQRDLLLLELGSLEKELAFLLAELVEGGQLLGVPLVDDLISVDQVESARKSTQVFSKFAQNLLPLLGVDVAKTYLLLFVDEDKVRPVGGKVFAYGLLTLNNGKVTELVFEEPEVIDGLIPGEVDKPEELEKYVEGTGWKFEDFAWSPDFSVAASRASWYVDKALGKEVFGVILFDKSALVSLIDERGGVVVSDGKVLAANNILQVVEESSEPSSVLAEVFSGLAERPFELYSLFARVVRDSVGDSHVLLWFSDKKLEEILREEGWAGLLKSVSCADNASGFSCLTDSVYVVESDLIGLAEPSGIERSYNLDLVMKDGVLSHRLVGTYKAVVNHQAYIRIYLPKQSSAYSASLVDSLDGTQSELEFYKGVEKDKEYFGVYLDLSGGGTKQVVYSWDVHFDNLDQARLVLLWQHQPGLQVGSSWVRVRVPEDYVLQVSEGAALTTTDSVGYNTKLDADLVIDLSWQKQR